MKTLVVWRPIGATTCSAELDQTNYNVVLNFGSLALCYMETWSHPQNRKCLTYRNAVRGGLSHGHSVNICTKILVKIALVVFSTRCNIYISRLCYDVSVRLSVRLSVTEVHWRIIANLGFKFSSHFSAHCGRRAMLASARLSYRVMRADHRQTYKQTYWSQYFAPFHTAEVLLSSVVGLANCGAGGG